MNKKGFTLIELIAVIVILGIVAILTVTSNYNYYQKSKEKSEQVFLKNLERSIENYIAVNIGEFQWDEYSFAPGQTPTKTMPNGGVKTISVKKNTTDITLQKIIDDKYFAASELVNPKDKTKKCDPNIKIDIYQDEDYVNCFKLDLDCVINDNENDINTCSF